jgi:predicted dehydrogenase
MPGSPRPLRFGLVGTGYWARITHAPALAATEDIEFAAVWGRNPQAAGQLAAGYGAVPYGDLDAFLAAVDAVAFSVPPDVQSEIAVRAARARKHLLLEKPIATAPAAADALVQAVMDANVASVVFFTARFQPDVRAWLADVAGQGSWAGGSGTWLGTALQESSPFNTPWRRDQGALWDLAPHVISLLWACLGPVVSVSADTAVLAGVTFLVLHHASGAASSVTVSLSATEAAEGFDLYVWGERGRSAAPGEASYPDRALRVALGELADNARSGRLDHPCDVRFGHAVGRVLTEAQRQIDAARQIGASRPVDVSRRI